VLNVSRPLLTGMAAAAALAVTAAAAAGSALPASARELAPANRAANGRAVNARAVNARAVNARAVNARAVNPAEWWLPAVDAVAAWRDAPAAGQGVTVAVLSTGVNASQPDLTGTVTTGPDFAKTGRRPGNAYWADEGTAVAGLIAGHGHGAGGAEGITGIAPGARILSVQVTLEYNDPRDADTAITGRLPAAIAQGIRYAVNHGASIISLPLDPDTLSAAADKNAAAGGSRAERAAVAYALAHDVLLVAPAGDNGGAGNAVNYPAAYPGVIAVGATARDGEPALFTNTGSYVALTAPGASGPAAAPGSAPATSGPAPGLTVAAPGGGYQTLASSDMSAALTAGVAALIRGRYPWLTAAEVTEAIEDGAIAPGAIKTSSARTSTATTAGRGHGALNAARALTRAAAIAAAHPRPTPTPPVATALAPPTPVRPAAASTAKPGSTSGTARSVLLDLLIAVGVLIAGLICLLAVTGVRRRVRSAKAADAARAGRGRGPGRHSRAQPPAPPAIRAAPAAGTPPRAAIGAGSVWDITTPSGRLPAGRAADAPLAPWEQSPSVFASAPVPKAPPPWPLSSSGPMYVWNPAATTGPINTANDPLNGNTGPINSNTNSNTRPPNANTGPLSTSAPLNTVDGKLSAPPEADR
jgi:subtilisin family serine protease